MDHTVSAPVVCTGNEPTGVVPSSCGVFTGLADAIVVHRVEDHRILTVNPTLAGWIDTDEPGGDFFELFTHDMRAEMRRIFSSRQELPGDFRLGRGARVRWVELVTRRGSFKDGEAWITTMRDVTERRRAVERADAEKARADATDRRRRDTIAAIGHELRTPVSGILDVAQVLNQAEVRPEHREYVETIHNTAESLMDILNEILDLTRLERGQLSIEEGPFSPRSVCDNCVKTMRMHPEADGIEVGLRIDDDVPRECIGDAAHIQQILSNLMTNALRFTHRGHVTLSLSLEQKRAEHVSLRFEIEDSGIGFDEELLPRIFEPFAHATGSSGPAYGGTGLGLSLSQELAGLMGSDIEVESAVGRGSRFHFVLVLGRSTEDTVDRSEHGNVLYVGATGPQRKSFVDVLRGQGNAVECCETSAVALERVRTRCAEGTGYETVYVEQQLPDLDGETFARSVRHRLRATGIRLVLVPPESNHVDAERAARSGFDLVTNDPRALDSSMAESRDDSEPEVKTVVDAVEAQTSKSSGTTDEADGEKPQTEAPSERSGPPRILVVEDNPVNQKVVCHMLRKMGFTVELAADGRAGVDRLAGDGPFDLVLMDCQMPVMDGYRATRSIRELEGGAASTPIVALTANAMDGDREKCLASGMDDYLSKPAKADQLREMLVKWIPACEARMNTD